MRGFGLVEQEVCAGQFGPGDVGHQNGDVAAGNTHIFINGCQGQTTKARGAADDLNAV
jgi:hypothetical protein